MTHPLLCTIIGWGCAILTFIGTIFSCVLLVLDIDRYYNEREKSNRTLFFVSDWDLAESIIAVIAFVAMFIASIFLIIGIKKKRHQFIAFWIGVIAVGIVLNLMRLIRSQRPMALNLVTVGVQVCLWYPIVSFYRELRSEQVTQMPENHPLTQQGAYASSKQQPSSAQPLYPSLPNADANRDVKENYAKARTLPQTGDPTMYPVLPKE